MYEEIGRLSWLWRLGTTLMRHGTTCHNLSGESCVDKWIFWQMLTSWRSPQPHLQTQNSRDDGSYSHLLMQHLLSVVQLDSPDSTLGGRPTLTSWHSMVVVTLLSPDSALGDCSRLNVSNSLLMIRVRLNSRLLTQPFVVVIRFLKDLNCRFLTERMVNIKVFSSPDWTLWW